MYCLFIHEIVQQLGRATILRDICHGPFPYASSYSHSGFEFGILVQDLPVPGHLSALYSSYII